jgi:CheY-like chemotaxis protein
MNAKPRFRVAVAGLDLRDVRLIEIVFKHCQYNRYEFALTHNFSVGAVDLLIANTHDSEGQAAVDALRGAPVPIPVISAVPRGESSSSRHAISIDRLTLQLLPIMNRVVELDLLAPDTRPMDIAAQTAMQQATDFASKQSQQTRLATDEFFRSPTVTVPSNSQSAPSVASPSPAADVQRPAQPTSSLAKPNESMLNRQSFLKTTSPTQAAYQTAQQRPSQPEPAQLNLPPRAPVVPPTKPNLVAFTGSKREASALRVLVVDDSPTVRQQLGQALEKMNFVVELAATGADALRRIDANHFDLALVDVVMPEMDGYKLTKEIKRDKKRKGMPVIILTSKSSPFDLARGALAGCDTFLTKPVPLKSLQEAIVKQLRKSLAIDDLSTVLKLSPTTSPEAPAAARPISLSSN